MSIRIILADDHQIVREGLRLILDRAKNIEVLGEAADGRSAVALVQRLSPDLVVMDIGMPDLNGMEATRQIKLKHPEVRVIGLSAYSDRTYVLGMLDAGASGYVLKAAAGDELVRAIHAVMAGQKYLSSEIAGILVDTYVQRKLSAGRAGAGAGAGDGEGAGTGAPGLLGPREREILQLLTEGKSSKAVAACLHISPATVETHRRNIMRKLDLHTIAELTKYAVREGLTALEP